MKVLVGFLVGLAIGCTGGAYLYAKYSSRDCSTNPPFEESIVVNDHGAQGASHVDFGVSGPAFLRLDRLDNPSMSRYCIEVLYASSCDEVERRFDDTSLVYFRPHCQSSIMALEFVLVGDDAEDLSLFYVDGRVTQSREEARTWVANDPLCSISDISDPSQ